MLDFLHQLAVQQYNNLSPAIRLVVLHPNYLPQHRLLTEITEPDTVYVRFEGSALTQTELERQLDTAVALQIGEGKHSQMSSLVLDECDRAVPASLDWLLARLLSQTGLKRLFVLARSMTHSLLRDQTLSAQTCLIPSHEAFMLWDYARRGEHAPALLEVYALGAGRALLNGKPLNNWDGALPRALFFFLADRVMTTRDEIFATFWPEMPVKEATNVFHVTKRKISEKLSTDLTNYKSGYYHIASGIELSYDVALFTSTLQESAIAETREEKIALLKRALYFYRGDFMSSINAPWVENRRLELRQAYGEALTTLYQLLEST